MCAPPPYFLCLFFFCFSCERPPLALCATFMRVCASGTLASSHTWVRVRRQHALPRAQPVPSCRACPVMIPVGSGTAARAVSVCVPRI